MFNTTDLNNNIPGLLSSRGGFMGGGGNGKGAK